MSCRGNLLPLPLLCFSTIFLHFNKITIYGVQSFIPLHCNSSREVSFLTRILLLLLLSHFSRVRLCVTPYMAAHQASPYLGFSRQEHWSGCHFFLQHMKVKSESKVAQSYLTLSDPMDCSLPGSSIHGIF